MQAVFVSYYINKKSLSFLLCEENMISEYEKNSMESIILNIYPTLALAWEIIREYLVMLIDSF